MKKQLLLTALLVPVLAFAQTFPSPTFNSVTLQNPLTAANGGTGATSSTGTGSTVLSASPTLTGAPVAPTAPSSTSNTQIATTGFVQNNFAAPQVPYGSVTPNSVAATTLSASGTVSGAGFASLLSPYAPLASPQFTGYSQFTNTSAGASVIRMTGNGATTPNKYIGVLNGSFTVYNSAGGTQLLSLTDAGALSVPSLSTTTAPIAITSGGTGSTAYPSPYVVSSIAGLRGISSAFYASVLATGYYAQGDGGGGSYQYAAGDTTDGAYFTGSISSTTLTASAVANGTLAVGQQINGAGISPGGCYISSLGTGSGGAGTYTLSCSLSVSSETMQADNGGSIIVASNGSRWVLTNSATFNVKQFGAIGNGTTDDYYPIQAALNVAPGSGRIIELAPATYRVSQGLTVSAGMTLRGQSFATTATGGYPQIIGDLSIASIVTLDGGGASQSAALLNVVVNRASGTVPASSASIRVQNTNNAVLQDTYAMRSAIGYAIVGQAEANVDLVCNRCISTQVTQYHVQIQNSVGITFTDSWFGRNGGLDVGATAYVNINGAAVDTVRFIASQFNQSGASVTEVLSFTGYANDPNGIITFAQCHMENWSTAVVAADGASTAIQRLRFVSNSINGTGAFYSGAAGTLQEFMLTGNTIDGAVSLTLDQQSSSVVTGNVISGTVTVNAGSQVMTGNYFTGSVTLEGASVKTIFTGNAIGGTLTNTMSGTFVVVSNG